MMMIKCDEEFEGGMEMFLFLVLFISSLTPFPLTAHPLRRPFAKNVESSTLS